MGTLGEDCGFSTQRLRIRGVREGDAEDFFKILSDPIVNSFLPWFPVNSLEETWDFMYRNYFAYYKRDFFYRYAVCRKEDDRMVGYLTVADGESRDMGYGFLRDCWGKGYATEAAGALLYKLKEAGYPYVTATHDRKNPASGEVMKKLSMRYCYTYEELWRPKNITVQFRMYQLNFDGSDRIYREYWDKYPVHFVENSSATENK